MVSKKNLALPFLCVMSYLDGLKCCSEFDKFSEGIKIQQKLLESRIEKKIITQENY